MNSDKQRVPAAKPSNRRGNRGGGGGGRRRDASTSRGIGRILVLHGNRQTGEMLLSRMDKLRKKLQMQLGYELVAIDAPHAHVEDPLLRTWWTTRETSQGLDATLRVLCETWNCSKERSSTRGNSDVGLGDDDDPPPFCGVLGFSQGARLAHLMALLHEHGRSNNHDNSDNRWFPGLKFVILAAGYDAPLPDMVRDLLVPVPSTTDPDDQPTIVSVPSLHVWGEADKLIRAEQSRHLSLRYHNPTLHVHDGGHHVPMRALNVAAYLDFVKLYGPETAAMSSSLNVSPSPQTTVRPTGTDVSGVESLSLSSSVGQPTRDRTDATTLPTPTTTEETTTPATPTAEPNGRLATALTAQPDPDNLQAQLDELEAIEAIYPDEFRLKMKSRPSTSASIESSTFNDFPIRYEVDLVRTDEDDDQCAWWPPRPVAVGVTYPPNYPLESGPTLRLVHANNVMELASAQAEQCLREMEEAAQLEQGMCCVLSCIQAAREYFESGRARQQLLLAGGVAAADDEANTASNQSLDGSDAPNESTTCASKLTPSSRARIEECNLQGLDIAESTLKAHNRNTPIPRGGKGGSWTYTIGLVGKPSAGKSTFFNVATAFARQRDDKDNALGGATMAPHPFTTIDPNVGYCLVPAPEGSCPEDGYASDGAPPLNIGSTHGRDPRGRRLLPVLLKDVAGLVPGAYQGRGRGNQFLNDLTDANVLIHVLDGSGTADAEGNPLGVESDGTAAGASDPLQDLAWIRNELIEWVYSNVVYKWDAIRAKGQDRLAKMFSGYGQPQAVTLDVLSGVEKYLESHEGRDRALANLYDWDEADVHRLVSTFLGVRFPMALAINKCDIGTSTLYVKRILDALPIHGAHVGVPMCAKSEMLFVRNKIGEALGKPSITSDNEYKRGNPPNAVWRCLQEAMELKEPVLVFPVVDFTTYASLPGLGRHATEDTSLPSAGMVACIQEAGGSAPSLWNESQRCYVPQSKKSCMSESTALRDVLIMKPGSTVDDCYVFLKRLGAVAGDFVRAEAAGDIGSAPKQVPKNQVITKSLRILKVMTQRKSSWQ